MWLIALFAAAAASAFGMAALKSCRQSGKTREGPEPSEYELRIDDQTERFLAKKPQLTYFIITAAVVPIGFAVGILNDRKVDLEFSWVWGVLVAGGVLGVLAAGGALISLWNDMRSWQRHIEYRYKRKTPDACEKKEWDRINFWAARFRELAFLLLVLEVGFLSAGLVDVVTV